MNPNIIRRIERTIALFNFNYRVEVAWWGQYTKETGKDIDEINGWDGVQFLTVDQWRSLVREVTEF